MNSGLDEISVCTQSRRVLNHRLCVYVPVWAMMCLWPSIICWSYLTWGHLLRLRVTVNDDSSGFPKASDLKQC